MKQCPFVFSVLSAACACAATVPYDGPAWPDAEVAFVPDAERLTSPVPPVRRTFDAPVTSAVRTVDGTPRFFVNGEELPLYWGSVNTGVRKDHLPRLAGLPYNVVTVRVNSRGIYSGRDKFDATYLANRLELFATNNPNCYFVYDVTVNPFRDWAKAHPDDLCRDEKGELTQDEKHVNWSSGSESAMGVITNFITRVIGWTENSKWANRIIAYRINSAHTTEWLGWQAKGGRLIDFSPAAERSFRAYATAKYGPSFATANIPTRAERGDSDGRILWNPRDHLAVTAFNEWCSERMADHMIAACSHAKRLLGGRKAVGTYFGYAMTLFSTGDAQTRAHYALKKVLDSHAVDFLCSPQDYGLRTLGENAIDMKPFGTLAMNGILSVIEDNTRTHHGRSLGVYPKGQSQTVNAFQSDAVLRRNFAFYLCRNQPLYHYDLNLGTGLDFPEWRRDAESLAEAQRYAARHRVGRHARIAVVSGEGTALVMPRLRQQVKFNLPAYDTDGRARMTVRERGLCTGELMTVDLSRLSRLGAPVDYLLAEDLADHPGDYDVYVFLGCFRTDPKMIAAVRKLQSRPCTLVWTYAPGYVKGLDASVDNMRELTGFDFRELDGAREPLARFEDGRTMGTPGAQVAPLFTAEGSRVLARYATGGEPAIVEKTVGKSRSVYSGVCLYDADFLRALVRQAGVFTYVDSDDPVEANDAFFALHARSSGVKTVRLPRKADVWDVFNRRLVARDADTFTFEAPIHSSWLFRMAPRSVVRVSDFGFDAADSTRFLQAALDSGADTVIVDRQAGAWVTLPLKGRSNQEVLFEDGVELVAKKGAFMGLRDYLLHYKNTTNVIIRGLGEKGGTLRMHKKDYQKPPYPKGEWRYALRLEGTVDALVENMSFVSSGGDGIVVCGGNRNVTIRKCVCDDNHRQGISVTSADGLLIEDTVLKNTSGTPPAAGIDWEPDSARERLVNCTMRRCRSEHNAGSGYEIFLPQLDKTSKPVGITFEDCVSIGNSCGTSIGYGDRHEDYASGCIRYRNCLFRDAGVQGISVFSKPACAFDVVFDDCAVEGCRYGWLGADVAFRNSNYRQPPVDGVQFNRLKVVQTGKPHPWFVHGIPSLVTEVPAKVSGSVSVTDVTGRTETVVLDDAWCRANLPEAKESRACPRARFDVRKLVAVDAHAGEMTDYSSFCLFQSCKYAFLVDRPRTVRFRFAAVPKNKNVKPAPLKIQFAYVATGAKTSTSWTPGDDGEVTFEAKKAGLYRIRVGSYDHYFRVAAADVPVAVDVREAQQMSVVPGAKPFSLYFRAPGGQPFTVVTCGSNPSASYAAKLYAPDGRLFGEKGRIFAWDVFAVPADQAAEGLWRLDGGPSKGWPYALFQIDLTGIPGFLFLDPTRTWR